MLCNIAELLTEVPAAGGMAARCRDYLAEPGGGAQIVIREELYNAASWPGLDPALLSYMESGSQFYWNLLRFDGLMLHASAVALEGRAYLFSGPCGRGKSTQSALWQRVFGAKAVVFNDDKPALRRLDGCWYAYGTPWCGKDGVNRNQKWPLGGVCFLEKADGNAIRRLSAAEALPLVLAQTPHCLGPQHMDALLRSLDALLRSVPMFLLKNRADGDAAILGCGEMRRAAEENGL